MRKRHKKYNNTDIAITLFIAIVVAIWGFKAIRHERHHPDAKKTHSEGT